MSYSRSFFFINIARILFTALIFFFKKLAIEFIDKVHYCSDFWLLIFDGYPIYFHCFTFTNNPTRNMLEFILYLSAHIAERWIPKRGINESMKLRYFECWWIPPNYPSRKSCKTTLPLTVHE